MVEIPSRIKLILLRKKLNSLLKSYYKHLRNKGDEMPTVNFPDWTEPVFPHLADDDLYEEEDDGDDE